MRGNPQLMTFERALMHANWQYERTLDQYLDALATDARERDLEQVREKLVEDLRYKSRVQLLYDTQTKRHLRKKKN